MPNVKRYGLIIVFFAALLVLYGCATTPEPPGLSPAELEKLVWPPPPDEPRVRFVASYIGSQDVGEGSSLLKIIGDEEGVRRFQRPHGVVADRKGNIFVSDTQALKVFKMDFERKRFTTIGESGIRQVKVPVGLAVDNDKGYLFVADLGSKTVMVYDKESEGFKFAIGQEPGTFSRPTSVALDTKTQRVYVSDTKLHMVRVFDYDGKLLFSIGKGERSDADDGFNVPSSVVVGKNGNLYVSDMFNRYIKVFTPDGRFIKKIGQGVGSGFGNFSKLIGMAIDTEGHLYGLDVDFGNVQIFDEQNNRLLTYVAKSGRQLGEFMLPTTIFIDERDRIYVTDTFNYRVQVFQYLGSKGGSGNGPLQPGK
jgi:DNA-binding beta-propeller fold protein YncE